MDGVVSPSIIAPAAELRRGKKLCYAGQGCAESRCCILTLCMEIKRVRDGGAVSEEIWTDEGVPPAVDGRWG